MAKKKWISPAELREAEKKIEILNELADYVKVLIEPIDKRKGIIEIKDFGLLYEFLKEILAIDPGFVIEEEGLEISAEELYKSAESELKEYEKTKNRIDRIIDRLKIESLKDIEKIDEKTRDELYNLVIKIKKLSPIYFKKSKWMQEFLEHGDSEMLELKNKILSLCKIEFKGSRFSISLEKTEDRREALKSILMLMSKNPDFVVYTGKGFKIKAREIYEALKSAR